MRWSSRLSPTTPRSSRPDDSPGGWSKPPKRRTTIMKVFLIGAAGGIGRRLSIRLTDRGDEVTGLHRAPAQADTVRATGAAPLTGDLVDDTVDELEAKISGHDAV